MPSLLFECHQREQFLYPVRLKCHEKRFENGLPSHNSSRSTTLFPALFFFFMISETEGIRRVSHQFSKWTMETYPFNRNYSSKIITWPRRKKSGKLRNTVKAAWSGCCSNRSPGLLAEAQKMSILAFSAEEKGLECKMSGKILVFYPSLREPITFRPAVRSLQPLNRSEPCLEGWYDPGTPRFSFVIKYPFPAWL